MLTGSGSRLVRRTTLGKLTWSRVSVSWRFFGGTRTGSSYPNGTSDGLVLRRAVPVGANGSAVVQR